MCLLTADNFSFYMVSHGWSKLLEGDNAIDRKGEPVDGQYDRTDPFCLLDIAILCQQ